MQEVRENYDISIRLQKQMHIENDMEKMKLTSINVVMALFGTYGLLMIEEKHSMYSSYYIFIDYNLKSLVMNSFSL